MVNALTVRVTVNNNFPIFDGDDPDLIKKLEVAQNMTCCIEKRMGIYPNVPNLVDDKTGGNDDE